MRANMRPVRPMQARAVADPEPLHHAPRGAASLLAAAVDLEPPAGALGGDPRPHGQQPVVALARASSRPAVITTGASSAARWPCSPGTPLGMASTRVRPPSSASYSLGVALRQAHHGVEPRVGAPERAAQAGPVALQVHVVLRDADDVAAAVAREREVERRPRADDHAVLDGPQPAHELRVGVAGSTRACGGRADGRRTLGAAEPARRHSAAARCAGAAGAGARSAAYSSTRSRTRTARPGGKAGRRRRRSRETISTSCPRAGQRARRARHRPRGPPADVGVGDEQADPHRAGQGTQARRSAGRSTGYAPTASPPSSPRRRACFRALAVAPAAHAATSRGPCVAGQAAPLCHFWTGKVTFVADGDTIRVDIDGDGARQPEDGPLHRHQRDGAVALQQVPRPPPGRVQRPRGHGADRGLHQARQRRRAPRRAEPREPDGPSPAALRRRARRRAVGRPRPRRDGAGPRALAAQRRRVGAQPRVPRAGRAGRRGQARPLRPERLRRRARRPRLPLAVDVNWDADGMDEKNLNGEWIDIRNLGATDVSLAGWWVRDSWMRGEAKKDIGFHFPAYAVVPAGGSVRVYVGCGENSAGAARALLLVPEGLRVRERGRPQGDGRRRLPLRPARQPARVDDLPLRR